ncbi:hypothetical protein OGY14_00615 [Citrobacter sp. Cpo073]|nr:hypothetical protein [Citrobacter sp. Cpo073]MDM2860700.1 hypothetical protein [Citrobacter sp. Cpo073]
MRNTKSTSTNPSQMQQCTCDFLHSAFDLCGGEA